MGLQKIGKRAVFKGETLVRHMLDEQKKACDCFVFVAHDTLVISVVELKSKSIHFANIKEKMDNAAEVVDLILQRHNVTKNYRFIPILLAKAYGTKPSNSPVARRLYVRFRGRNKSVFYGKCGEKLIDVIKKYDV